MSAQETPEKTETASPRPGAVPRLRLVPVTAGEPRFAPKRLSPGVTYLGRTASNDIVLESELVSRRHAKLILTDMGVTIHDLDSHNGVFLDGKKVRSAPVTPGQLLYLADVCCTLEPVSDDDGDFDVDSSLNRSNLVSAALGGGDEDTPAVRNLATLYRTTDLFLQADDETFFVEVVSACQALTEASVAVLVAQDESGALSTPVTLREGTGPKRDAPVSWPVVRRAIDERVALFSRDAEADPLVPGGVLASDERGAIMCVPILSEARVHGALYLARPSAGQGFTDRELETLSAVAHLVAVRMAGGCSGLAARAETGAGDAGASAEAEGLRVKLADLNERLVGLERELEAARAEAKERADALERFTTERAQGAEAQGAIEKELEAARARADAARKERDDVAHERDAARKERDTVRKERDAALGERDAAHDERDAALRERDVALQERDAALGERDVALAELRAAAEERDAAQQALASARQELEEARAALGSADEERAALAARLGPLESEAQAARAHVETLEHELEAERVRLSASEAKAAEAGALSEVLERALPSRVAGSLRALAAGAPPGEVSAGASTLLCVSLSGLDAWAQSASPDDVKARLDWFCAKAREACAPVGGEVEQSLGHTLLARFPSGGEGALGAVRAALELAKEAAATGAAVQAGVHVGADVSGVFGPGGTLVHVGEAAAVARGAAEFAQAGTVYVSEAVRVALGAESGLLLVALGPHIIRGLSAPVNLFQLVSPDASQEGGAA